MTVSVEEARTMLPELITLMQTGLPIIITRDDQPVARLVAEGPPPEKKVRKSGTMKGTVLYMAPDFDAPLDMFKEYTP